MKRPNASGCIGRLPGNRRKPYRVRVTTGFETDENGRTRQVQKTIGTFATYQEAEEALAAFNRNPVIDNGATFAEIYEEWSREKYAASKPSLVRSYQAAYNAVPMLHDLRFKTQAGRRRVPQAARTALFWQARAEVGISYIVPLSVQNDDPDVRYVTFKREFKNAMNRIGLPEHLPHDTRHTTATLLHAAGVDPYIVKRILGHASQDVTEAIYTHISDEQLREAIDKI